MTVMNFLFRNFIHWDLFWGENNSNAKMPKDGISYKQNYFLSYTWRTMPIPIEMHCHQIQTKIISREIELFSIICLFCALPACFPSICCSFSLSCLLHFCILCYCYQLNLSIAAKKSFVLTKICYFSMLNVYIEPSRASYCSYSLDNFFVMPHLIPTVRVENIKSIISSHKIE